LVCCYDTITPEDWQNLRAKSTPQEFKSMVLRNNHAVMICHDQEPLDFDRYSFENFQNIIKKNIKSIKKHGQSKILTETQL
jgi:predicted secreted Zn-dependent protease